MNRRFIDVPGTFSSPCLSRATMQPLGVALALMLLGAAAVGAEKDADNLLRQAHETRLKGDVTGALDLINQAITAEPKSVKAYFARGLLYENQRDHRKAIADFTKAIELDASLAVAFHHRGSEYFKLGRVRESLADFNKAVQLAPQTEPQHWQRGISQYYAGRYEDGRRQFELHQTVNANDVENAVWHYLCVARLHDVPQARKNLIEIKGDARVPMMQVHALYAGTAKPEDVLAAATSGSPPPTRLKEQLFYAHLYLGLYYEAAGNDEKTREHIFKAATEYAVDHYMGDVARVHAGLLRTKTR